MSRKNVIANRYEVVQHIGQGGMADVFRAVDTILNREVAIKILRADQSTDVVSILRFEREAQAATALAHPNIVEIYDVGDYKGHHYIVMEYVRGMTLKQVIRERGPLLNEEAVDIMKQLTSAVSEAHNRGIIHRDIKPQNVIVKADGSVKILDFGIAMAKGSMQLTQANNVMGSVHYLAPELARGESASPQSDIYALGIVLYEMLAGDVPFKAEQAVQVALRHMREKVPSVRIANPTVPQSIDNIIARATAKNPADRYRSCAEMYYDLSTCLQPERMNEEAIVIAEPQKPKEEQPKKPEKEKPVQKVHKKEPEKKPEPEHPDRLKLLLGLLGILVVIGTFAALVMSGVISFGPKTANVPYLEGLNINEAKDACEESGLILDTSLTEYVLTDDTEKGIVVSSDPAAGTELEKNSTVTVTLSSGIGVYMEDFAAMNMTIGKAEEYINEAVNNTGNNKYDMIRLSVIEEPSDTVEPGHIIRQEGIAPGTLYNPEVSASLTLVYASYPTVTIPADIIGLPISDAVARLEAMGIVVRTSNRDISSMTQEQIDELQFGVVIDADPGVGNAYTQKEDNYVILYYY